MQTNVEFITGSAGTGKTTLLKSRIHGREEKTNRHYGTLTATTGIAAVNLSGANGDSVTTVHSALKFFDTRSLKTNYAEGKLQKQLFKLLALGANLCIDEISMFSAEDLDILYMGFEEFNSLQGVEQKGGLGLVVSGDFCQLPPIEGEYAFNAQCWPNFASGLNRLTKIWRQDNLEFLEAINAARQGDGTKCADVLSSLEGGWEYGQFERGEEGNFPSKIFYRELDLDFDGTTILPLNRDVDRFNSVRLTDLLRAGKKKIEFNSYRWGQQRTEWKQVPDILTITEDSYVMILSNHPPDFDYANGDCGYVKTAGLKTCTIQLKRNDNVVLVEMVTRKVYEKETPSGMSDPVWEGAKEWKAKQKLEYDDVGTYYTKEEIDQKYEGYLAQLTAKYRVANRPYFDYKDEKWVTGEITYLPVRLAYASTCHKTQGLTLDNVQINPENAFFGKPSMFYVALSRVRSHKGLRIVGSAKLVEGRTNISEEVLPWI